MKILQFASTATRQRLISLPTTRGDRWVVYYRHPRQPPPPELVAGPCSEDRRSTRSASCRPAHRRAPAGSCWKLALGSSAETGHCFPPPGLLHLVTSAASNTRPATSTGNWCWAAGAAHRCAGAEPLQGLGELGPSYARGARSRGRPTAVSAAGGMRKRPAESPSALTACTSRTRPSTGSGVEAASWIGGCILAAPVRPGRLHCVRSPLSAAQSILVGSASCSRSSAPPMAMAVGALQPPQTVASPRPVRQPQRPQFRIGP